MNRISRMSLKSALFWITAAYLIVGIVFGALSFWGCLELQDYYAVPPYVQIQMDENDQASLHYTTEDPSSGNPSIVSALMILQFALPIFFIVLALILADITFYRIKLKKPIKTLRYGAERIQQQDLDFTVDACGEDELGLLCKAFETMRRALLDNNRRQWQMMEERKRLNAAFAHDLRNPITVIKGSARILKKNLNRETPDMKQMKETAEFIAQYANRLEAYTEAMTQAQKLEDLSCFREEINFQEIASRMEQGISLLCAGTKKQYLFSCEKKNIPVWADQQILQNTAENLVNNALRFADLKISVSLEYREDKILLCVSDDGPGFSQQILQKGASPFLRDDTAEHSEHFGMGLYICRLLCEKHGGTLTLKNTSYGAEAEAVFSCGKP